MEPRISWRVAVDEEETTAIFEAGAPRDAHAVFVCAHGAGGHREDRGMVGLAAVLRARGFGLVRFNFLYRENGSGRPDPMPRLKRCLSAVVSRTRKELGPRRLIIGGRSMGGRAASMLAADGMACDALLLLAYPLHPAGKPEQLRDAHLPQIKIPVLCFSGTRDALCRRDLMENVLASVRAPWEMHWLEGADHSFHVLQSSGRTDADVLEEVGDASQRWLARV
ncbi:MAG TPA: alpha/beta family hydrolase [Ktedonobacterales bacterium]|nr:alpha/beta family hydrolase [Ktedonobacterales bacterium]